MRVCVTVRFLLSALTCFAIAALAACNHSKAPEAEVPIAVSVRTLQGTNAQNDIRYSANIQPNTQVSLSFQVSGYVESITQVKGADGNMRPLQGGDYVRNGELLASIHEGIYREQLDNEQAKLDGAVAQDVQSRANFDRAQQLIKARIISQSDYDAAVKKYKTAEAQVDSARAAVQQARINVGFCKLYAPMDGVILQRQIDPGTLASPGVTAFTMADTREVKAVFGVPATVVKKLQLGQRLTIKTEAYAKREFAGTLTSIAPNADPTTRVFNIEVTIPNEDGRLKTGMVASLSLDQSLANGDVLTVPLDALVKLPGQPDRFGIYVVEQHDGYPVARLHDVELGSVIGNEVAITGDTKLGDQVIIRGASIVTNGARVNVIPQ